MNEIATVAVNLTWLGDILTWAFVAACIAAGQA